MRIISALYSGFIWFGWFRNLLQKIVSAVEKAIKWVVENVMKLLGEALSAVFSFMKPILENPVVQAIYDVAYEGILKPIVSVLTEIGEIIINLVVEILHEFVNSALYLVFCLMTNVINDVADVFDVMAGVNKVYVYNGFATGLIYITGRLYMKDCCSLAKCV